MAEVLLLSGAGRFADPWHPFAQTSERLAGLLTELGHRVRNAHRTSRSASPTSTVSTCWC